jgi:hypothetical protein
LIKWENLPNDQATWEDASFIQKIFPAFHPWGQVWFHSGGVVTPCQSKPKLEAAWGVHLAING